MCGIAGYVGTRHIDADAIDRCLACLEHRGPDEGGAQQFAVAGGRSVLLINRRLRIIDLDSRARQPLQFGAQWLTYNGELYNHVELRERLEREGVKFRTTSDSEVMAAVLAREGVDGLDWCEGMWALAQFNQVDGSLTLARDRFGEKPLYLHRDSTGLYFASEIKALRALTGRSFDVNLDQLRRYLVNGYRSLYKTGETFFHGVSELASRTWLRIDGDGRDSHGRYWTPRVCPDEGMPYAEAVNGVRRLLERAVELRLRADVPLAFCLSGGIDSNAIAAIAHRVFGYDVHAFTVVDPDPRYNEASLAEAASRALGLRHTEVPVVTGSFLSDLRTLVRAHDGPVATISYFVHWTLMREIARAGFRVSVSGTGADELLSGYYDHHLYYLHDVQRDPAIHAAASQAWAETVLPLVRNRLLRDPDSFARNPNIREHLYLDAEVFARRLQVPWEEAFSEHEYTRAGVLRNRMLNELFNEAVPVILHEDDLNAMYFSIENRSPFLDRPLFEFCGRIPTPHLIQRGLAKAVLRDAVRDLVPAVIVDNPRKMGFNASILSLLDAGNPAVRAEVLADSPVFDVVRRDAIAPLLDRIDLDNSESKFLFNFLNAKMFLEETA